MRSRVGRSVAILALAAGMPSVPAHAQGSTAPFAAHGSGAAIVFDVLRTGELQGFNLKTAFAGQVVNSLGLGAPTLTESDIAVQPIRRGSQVFARGSGAEAGVLTPVPGIPDPNQVVLSAVAEALAPPTSDDVEEDLGTVGLGHFASGALFRGRAHASFDLSACASGQVLGRGEGEASGLQVLGENGGSGIAASPGVSRTSSATHLLANGDGTFGLVSEVRQRVAPVTVLGGLVTVELLGEWVLRAAATGRPGGAQVEYAPVGAGPTTPVVRVNDTAVTLQQLLSPEGFVLDLSPLARIRVGSPARAAFGTEAPRVSPDGTSASGAVDAVQVSVLELPVLALTGADVRIGHMEAGVVVPSGGLRCDA